jgi:hypothetical protein
MRTIENRWMRILWSVVNVGLLLSVVGLGSALRRALSELEQRDTRFKSRELQLAEELKANTDAEKAKVARLISLVASLRTELSHLKTSGGEPAPRSDRDSYVDDSRDTNQALAQLASRPAVHEIPILDKHDYDALVSRRQQMPRALLDTALLSGDIDSVLLDPSWNPSGRDLDDQERLELAVAMKDYLFFARLSPMDRVKKQIVPLLDGMREQGAYVEYHADEAPPQMEGAEITHSEATTDRQSHRLYVFRKDEYPEMHHAQTVERQRALEMFVRAYENINPVPAIAADGTTRPRDGVGK